MEDVEIGNEMLEEAKKKKQRDYKKIAHLFKIHYYKDLITRDKRNKVVKCIFCGGLHCTSDDGELTSGVFSCAIFLVGFSLSLYGIGDLALLLIGNPFKWNTFLFLAIGLPNLWYALKRAFERLWMDET